MVAVVAVLLIAGGVWIALNWSSGPRDNGTVGKEPLRVDPNGGGKMFRTIQDAVNKASQNDHIVLMADIQEDNVSVTNKTENLTIEAEPGKKITWRLSGGYDGPQAPGLQLKDAPRASTQLRGSPWTFAAHHGAVRPLSC